MYHFNYPIAYKRKLDKVETHGEFWTKLSYYLKCDQGRITMSLHCYTSEIASIIALIS